MTSSLIPFVDKVSIISWVGIWAESVTTLCYMECMKKNFQVQLKSLKINVSEKGIVQSTHDLIRQELYEETQSEKMFHG